MYPLQPFPNYCKRCIEFLAHISNSTTLANKHMKSSTSNLDIDMEIIKNKKKIA